MAKEAKIYHFRLKDGGQGYNIPALGCIEKDGQYLFELEEDSTFTIERLASDQVAIMMTLPPDAVQVNEGPIVDDGADDK